MIEWQNKPAESLKQLGVITQMGGCKTKGGHRHAHFIYIRSCCSISTYNSGQNLIWGQLIWIMHSKAARPPSGSIFGTQGIDQSFPLLRSSQATNTYFDSLAREASKTIFIIICLFYLLHGTRPISYSPFQSPYKITKKYPQSLLCMTWLPIIILSGYLEKHAVDFEGLEWEVNENCTLCQGSNVHEEGNRKMWNGKGKKECLLYGTGENQSPIPTHHPPVRSKIRMVPYACGPMPGRYSCGWICELGSLQLY